MRIRSANTTTLPRLTALAGLVVSLSVEPVHGFGSAGPGTQGAGVPQPFSIQDFDSVRRNNFPFPTTMSPGVLQTLGGCVDPEGIFPNSPKDLHISIENDRTSSEPLILGVSPSVCISLRSSSLRWFETPPRVEVLFVGLDVGTEVWFDIDRTASAGDGASNTFLVGETEFHVPDLPAGSYRFYVFERTTGLCKASDFTFRIEGDGPEGTPTPTPTPTVDLTPTPTPTRTPAEPTPTRTLRIPDYDNSDFVNGVDLPGFLTRLIIRSEEADLDGEDAEAFRDVFMFSLWWQNDRLRD
jgi:hypothetical protein